MNQVPGSFSAASAPSGDCGRVLVTLPAASSPRSTAEEEQDTKTRVRTVETTATVQELERKKESKIEKEKKNRGAIPPTVFHLLQNVPKHLRGVKILL